MFSTTFKRTLVTLAVVIGLLAAAGPAGAAGIEAAATPRSTVTMLDYEGQTVVTYSFVVDGPFTLKGTAGNVSASPLPTRRSA